MNAQLRQRGEECLSRRLGPVLPAALALFVLMAAARAAAQPAPSPSQSAPAPAWQIAAGGHLEFEVVSIHPDGNADDPPRVNVPFGPDDAYYKNGGVFLATNWPVFRLISFAFKNTTSERQVFRASLPGWAGTEGFNIEARSDNPNPTKDQMRLMVQSMLFDRFHLKVHYETRVVPVYAAELVKPGVFGPNLRPHPANEPCAGAAATISSHISPEFQAAEQETSPNAPPPPPNSVPGGYPIRCGSFVRMEPSAPYLRHEGGRDLTMAQIISTFSGMGALSRPVVDHTGLTGTYDWVMQFIDMRPGHVPPPDAEGLNFSQALWQQNGIKLVKTKAPFTFLIVDHIDQPTAN